MKDLYLSVYCPKNNIHNEWYIYTQQTPVFRTGVTLHPVNSLVNYESRLNHWGAGHTDIYWFKRDTWSKKLELTSNIAYGRNVEGLYLKTEIDGIIFYIPFFATELANIISKTQFVNNVTKDDVVFTITKRGTLGMGKVLP